MHKGIRYHCDKCEYAASNKSYLKKHKNIKHEGIKHPCDQCNYTATDKVSNLKRHKASIHKSS